MKRISLSAFGLVATAVLIASAPAATINFSGTAVGNRIVTTTDPFSPASGGTLILGTMSNDTDFSSFSEFGRTAMGSNAAYSSGVINGATTNNTSTAANFASKPIYLVIYTEGNIYGGIYKSTATFDATLSGTASQTFNVAVTSFTTAINPTQNWDYWGISAVDPQGITGYAATGGNLPTERRGMVFDLNSVPEPSSGILALAGLGLLTRRRR